MNLKISFGFSIIEVMVSMLILSFILMGSLSINEFLVKTHGEIASAIDIEDIHSHFEYVLLRNGESCSASLAGKLDGAKNVPINIFTDEEYDKYTDFKENGILKNIELSLDKVYEDKGYANLTFNYNKKAYLKYEKGNRERERANHQYKKNSNDTIIKKLIRVAVSVEMTDRGVKIKNCLSEEAKASCPDDVSFITSFNETNFDPFTQYSIPAGTPIEERLSGKEYIYKSSNIYKDLAAEYCVSYNICVQGDWISRSLCYDSCRNKFWADGMLSYGSRVDIEDKNEEEDYEPFVCESETFHYDIDCLGKSLQFSHLKKGNIGKRHTPPPRNIIDSYGKKIGYFQSSFECSYAGTWILKSARCFKKSGTSYNYKPPGWDMHNPNHPLKCSTNSRYITVHSEDRTKQQSINLGDVYPDRRFLIGEPKRLLISFKNEPTSATIVCKKQGSSKKWIQVGNSIKNCEELNQPLPLVDILFVIDNSGSMGGPQKELLLSIPQFIDVFFKGDAKKINYNIAVSTTDSRLKNIFKKSSFRSPYDPNDPQIIQLANSMKVGVGGSGHEQPILSAGLALTDTNFYRESAYLAILFITDECNRYEASYTDQFISRIINLKKGDTNRIIVHASLTQTLGCDTGTDLNVAKVTNRFNGDTFDIKKADGYGDELAKFAKDIVDRILVLGN